MAGGGFSVSQTPFALPPGMELMMADVCGGSETPSMVRKVGTATATWATAYVGATPSPQLSTHYYHRSMRGRPPVAKEVRRISCGRRWHR